MKVVKFMPGNSLIDNSRNRREIGVLLTLGYKVCAISSDENKVENYGSGEFQVIHDEMTRLTYAIPRVKRILVVIKNYLKLMRMLRLQNADIVSCHDLTSLGIAYAANILKHKKPMLIYDSHEFELGRHTSKRRSQFNSLIIERCEGFLIRRCVFSIMVNESIAEEVQRIHRLKDRPLVVRSVPERWVIDERITKMRRREILSKLGYEEDMAILMYHGGVMPGRGIENMLRAMSLNKYTVAVILGNGREEYKRQLDILVEDLGIKERVLFHKAVPYTQIWEYSSAADIEFCLIQPIARSYQLSLPNKLFESIQSMTPIIASKLPELSKIIEGYQIGILTSPTNIEEISNAIDRILNNEPLFAKFKHNLIRAKQELCWENERIVLETAYRGLKDA